METLKNIQFILQTNTIYFGTFFFILGACLASFFNVVILRLPKIIEQQNATDIKDWFEEKGFQLPEQIKPLLEKFNLSYPSSHCYSCHNPLKWYHNIPIISYFFLKGKCGYCNIHISLQYPIVEFLGGLLLLSAYLIFIPQGLSIFILGSILFLLSFILIAIDFKMFLLPDSLTMTLLWIGLVSSTFGITLYNLSPTEAIYGATIGYLILLSIATIGKAIKGVEVMGAGDFKLLAALGAFIGIKGVIFTVFSSSFIGILTWIILKSIGKHETMIPYGPSLIIAAMLYLFYGKMILSLFGISF